MAHHDGDEHNAGNRDGRIKENDGVHNDGNEGSVGNDVDEVNDDDIDYDGKNRFICTSDNHRGPCGWKIAHGCIFEDHEVPIQAVISLSVCTCTHVRTSTFFGFFVHVCHCAEFFFRMGISFVYLYT